MSIARRSSHMAVAAMTTVALIAAGTALGQSPLDEATCKRIGGDLVCEGQIALGQPTAETLTISEVCSGDERGPAVDAETFRLPEEAEGRAARLEFSSDGDADLGVNFNDFAPGQVCVARGSGGMRDAPANQPEEGFVPFGHRSIAATVVATQGVNVKFTLTIEVSKPHVIDQPLPRLQGWELEDFSAKAEDGTLLKGHIYKPKGPGPFATVLVMNPYWNTQFHGHQQMPGEGTHFSREYRYLLDAGFAVALVNPRGSGLSGGECLQFGNETDVGDVRTVIETLAAKTWSNRNVGMMGHSYGGWTGMMGIASKAKALKAVVAMSPVIDPWNLNTLRGVFQMPQTTNVLKVFYEAQGVGVAYQPFRFFQPECTVEQLPAELNRRPTDINQQAPLWNGDRNEYYRSVDLRPELEGSRIPLFVTSGMVTPAGIANGEQHILQFEGLWDLLRGDVRMMLGQWEHSTPTLHRHDFPSQVIGWFDQYLRGGPQVVEPGVVEYQDDSLVWNTAGSWPPVTAEERWLLSAGNLVKQRREVKTSMGRFAGVGYPCMRVCLDEFDDPSTLSLTLPRAGTPACILGNHVAYVSRPLGEDLQMAGNFTLDLTLESTLEDGNIYAYLLESDTGDCKDEDARIVARAVGDLRHVESEGVSWEQGRPNGFPTNEKVKVTMLSLPFSTTVREGKRLVLAIGGDGREGATMPDSWRPVITVHTGQEVRDALRLPLVP